jgi:hypothetical protein
MEQKVHHDNGSFTHEQLAHLQGVEAAQFRPFSSLTSSEPGTIRAALYPSVTT